MDRYSDREQGIPPSALVSEVNTERVDVARHFRAAGEDNRRPAVDRDHSLILVLLSGNVAEPRVLVRVELCRDVFDVLEFG